MHKVSDEKFNRKLSNKSQCTVKENNSIVPDQAVMSKIYVLRGQSIMLDRDLAELYGVKTIRLRQ